MNSISLTMLLHEQNLIFWAEFELDIVFLDALFVLCFVSLRMSIFMLRIFS